MEWYSWLIAIVLGISAVISPVITAWINNEYQLKMKNIEVYELAKRQALENFVKQACNLKYSSSVRCF